MNKKLIKIMLLMILFVSIVLILSTYSKADYVSANPSKTTGNPGEEITINISSDCVGRVNITVSNGTVSPNRVWIEGTAQPVTVKLGTSGTTTVTVTPENGKMSNNGVDVDVSPVSTSISINSEDISGNTNSGNNGGASSNPGTSTTAKSSNANLSNLGIRPNDFSGFRPGTTTYNVTVPNETETIEVYANKAESAQTISGTGTKTLNEGVNTFNVVVTAADGQTKKTYTINVTREASDEETTDENEEQPLEDPTNIFGLSSLDITGVTLTPEFQTDVYEYNVDVTSDINKLELQTVATEANANVEITGNENFQEGENIVTIIVTDESGENTVTYQIIVNKKAAVEETTEEEPATDWRKIICIGLIALLVIVVIIIIIVKRRRNNAEVQEYMGLYNNDDEFDDEDNYNNNFNKMNNDFIDDNYNYQDNNTTEFNSTTDKEDTTEYSTKDIAENIENDENNEEETKSTHIIPDEFFEDDEPPVKKKRSKGKRFK